MTALVVPVLALLVSTAALINGARLHRRTTRLLERIERLRPEE